MTAAHLSQGISAALALPLINRVPCPRARRTRPRHHRQTRFLRSVGSAVFAIRARGLFCIFSWALPLLRNPTYLIYLLKYLHARDTLCPWNPEAVALA